MRRTTRRWEHKDNDDDNSQSLTMKTKIKMKINLMMKMKNVRSYSVPVWKFMVLSSGRSLWSIRSRPQDGATDDA